jgi:hypothetical protein
MGPFVLEPIPDFRRESSEAPAEPGKVHGEQGPRLVIQVGGGYSVSTRTGCWQWCDQCGEWKKAVGVMWPLGCLKCGKVW